MKSWAVQRGWVLVATRGSEAGVSHLQMGKPRDRAVAKGDQVLDSPFPGEHGPSSPWAPASGFTVSPPLETL